MQNDKENLEDIRLASERVALYIVGMTQSEFVSDAKTTAAVEREITIMGEAVARISIEFKNDRAEVPWKRLVKLRNFYIHAYERLTPEEVWRTANRLIPRVGRLVAGLIPDNE